MKKLLALLLALVMVFALCACGSSTDTPAPAATPAEAPADDTPAAEPIHIMFGHDNLPGEPLTEAAEFWAEELEKVSGQELDPNEEIDLIARPLDDVIGEMGTGISDNALMTATAALVMKEERKRGGKLL